jgi:hypothetical protein
MLRSLCFRLLVRRGPPRELATMSYVVGQLNTAVLALIGLVAGSLTSQPVSRYLLIHLVSSAAAD